MIKTGRERNGDHTVCNEHQNLQFSPEEWFDIRWDLHQLIYDPIN